MNAGTLDTPVTFEQDLGTSDASGQQVENWQVLAADVWCEVTPLSGRELFAAQQLVAQVTHRIRTRYRTDIALTRLLRARICSRVLHMQHLFDPGEKHVELEMLATEVI